MTIRIQRHFKTLGIVVLMKQSTSHVLQVFPVILYGRGQKRVKEAIGEWWVRVWRRGRERLNFGTGGLPEKLSIAV